jgi:Flp pilus assembly protein TadB
MTVWEDNDGPKRQSETATPPRINWRASAWVLAILAALVGLLLCAGCGPLPGPAGNRIGPAPERGLATIQEATTATAGELATVCTSTTAIKGEVADLVPVVRTVETLAPEPAERIKKGHAAIFTHAQNAETAAGQAQAQVETISASASQAQKDLDFLRAETAKELAARDKRITELENDANNQTRRNLTIGAAIGAALFALGIALVVWLPARPALGLGLAVAGGAVALLAFTVRAVLPYLPWLVVAVVVAAIVALVAWLKRQERKTAVTVEALDGAIYFGEQVKAGKTIEQAGELAKRNVPKPARDLIWERLPTEPSK